MSRANSVPRGFFFLVGGVAGGPIPPMAVAFFVMLFATAAVWLLLIARLFSLLRDRHPAAYEAMGSPSLFWNNSVRNQWLFLKFVMTSRGRNFDDREIVRLVGFIRIILVVYPMLFVAGAAALFLG